MRYYLALLGMLLGAPALAQPTCPVGTPTGAIQCLPQAVAPLATDVVSGVQQTGPTRANQTVKVSISQIINSGFAGSFSTLGASGAASLLGGGTLTGTFAGNPTFSGIPVLGAGATLQGALASSGGSLAGSFAGSPTWTGTHTFNGPVNGAGTFTVPLGPSTAIPTSGDTAVTVSDTFGQGINATAFGVKCDGATDDFTALQNAINVTAAAQKRLLIGPSSSTCNIGNTLVFANNAMLIGIGNPTIKLVGTSHPMAMDLRNTSNVELGGFTINGNQTVMLSADFIIRGGNTYYAYIHDLTINEPSNGIAIGANVSGVGSAYNRIMRVAITNAGVFFANTAVGFTFAHSRYNLCEDCSANGQGGFTVWAAGDEYDDWYVRPFSTQSGVELVGTEHDTARIQIINPRVVLPAYTQWATGITVTSGELVYYGYHVYSAGGAGTTGATPPTCTVGTCSDGTITWTFVRNYVSTGDNCISLVGSYSLVSGGTLEGCYRVGIGVFGDHNTIVGNKIKNIGQGAGVIGSGGYYGITLASRFAGIPQYNTVTGNVIEDTQAAPTTIAPLAFDTNYLAWAPSTVYAANTYLTNAGHIYRTFAGGTSGASAPTCVSAPSSCSDGGVTWVYQVSYTGSTAAQFNTVGDNVYGASQLSVPYVDLLKTSFNSWMLTQNGIASSDGNPRGAGAADLQMTRLNANEVCAGDNTFCAGTNNTVSANNSFAIGSTNTVSGIGSGAFGASNSVSGQSSFAFGSTNTASGASSLATGTQATDRGRRGVRCFATGVFSAVGDGQACDGVLRRSGTTTMQLTANANTASSSNLFNIPADTVAAFPVLVACRDNTTSTAENDVSWYFSHVHFSVANTLNTASMKFAGVACTSGSPCTTATSVESNGTGSTATIAMYADTTLAGVVINVTPPNADTWHCSARIGLDTEVQ